MTKSTLFGAMRGNGDLVDHELEAYMKQLYELYEREV